jgi:solute carrier family 35 protein F1/2
MFSTLSFYIPLSIIFIGLLIREERRNSVQQKYSSALADIDDEFAMPGEVVNDHSNLGSNRDDTTSLSTRSGGRISQMIGAKPEKRNHLLSRWSEGAGASSSSPSLNETTEDRSLNMIDPCYSPGSADDDSNHYSQTSIPPNKSNTLFGLIPLRLPKRKYALVAIFDVYANYTTILAYKYTTITDVALFDAMAIPSSIIVSRCFFGRKYTKIHFLAVLACGIGIALNVWQDYREDEKVAAEDDSLESDQEKYIAAEYPHKVAGDALAILGGILFGISNTLAEVTIKDSSLIEYLGLMTLFASIIASIQAIFTERGEIISFYGQSSSPLSSSASDATTTCTKAEGELFFFLFAIGGIVTYAGVAGFLQISDAAFFTLSLLTGDAWSVIFSVFVEGIKPPPTFYIALAITLSGVIIYETAPSPVIDSQKQDGMGDLQLTETSNSNGSSSSSSSSTSRGLAVQSREKQNEVNEFVITDDDDLDNDHNDFVIT